MTTITKIGNSRGVRIPKAIIKQANLENTEIEFKIGNESLIKTYFQSPKRLGAKNKKNAKLRTQNPKAPHKAKARLFLWQVLSQNKKPQTCASKHVPPQNISKLNFSLFSFFNIK